MTGAMQTERLTRRPCAEEDAAAFVSAVRNRVTARIMPGMPWPFAVRHARDFIAEPAAARALILAAAHAARRAAA